MCTSFNPVLCNYNLKISFGKENGMPYSTIQ